LVHVAFTALTLVALLATIAVIIRLA